MSPTWLTPSSRIRPAQEPGCAPASNRGAGVGDEDRRDGELELIGQPRGQELREHRGPALDHQLADAPGGEIGEQPAQVHHPEPIGARGRPDDDRHTGQPLGDTGGAAASGT
jgi:hypothetical protein